MYPIPSNLANGILAASAVALIVYYVLLVVAGWKIFEKAGESGWKSIVPIYNIYIMYKIVKMEKWFWIVLATSFIVSLITTFISPDGDMENVSQGNAVIVVLLTLIEIVLALYVQVVYSIRTSRVFGHGTGYAIGLFFLSNIFWLILGLGKSKYDKKQLKNWE